MMLTYDAAVVRLLGLVDHERGPAAGDADSAAGPAAAAAAGRRLPRQHRIYDLRGIARLLERLGNPHQRAGIVHIAGTKGKGSTAAMVESILRGGRASHRVLLLAASAFLPRAHPAGRGAGVGGAVCGADGGGVAASSG